MKKMLATLALAVCAAFTASASVNLGNLTKNKTVKDGQYIVGTLTNENVTVSIADGATVTIADIEIQKTGKACAGLTCKGDATIILDGVHGNKISACGDGFPGIFVPAGHTLTIKGFGKLDVNGEGYAAGIGGGDNLDCGNIIIDGGTITASGGMSYGGSQEVVNGNLVIHVGMPGAGPGIGSGRNAKCGNIFFKRGNVTATGTEGNPGIGADCTGGYNALVKFYNSIGKVTAITMNGDNTFTYDHALFDSLPVDECWCWDSAITHKETRHDYHVGGYNRVHTFSSVLGGLNGNKTFKEGSEDGFSAVNKLAGVTAIGGTIYTIDDFNDVDVPTYPVLRGELSGNHKISIAKNTTVFLDGVTIGPSLTSAMPGITCNGNATIILKGENYVEGCGDDYPGIFVPKGCVLTIKGDGSLTAVGGGSAPGIGACNPDLMPGGKEGSSNYQKAGGQVKILSGKVTAVGGRNCAAIGVMFNTDEGMYQHGTQPEIYGGTVCAKGGIKLKGTTACWFSPAVESYLPEGVKPSNSVEYFRWNGLLDELPRGTHIYAVAESGTTIRGRMEVVEDDDLEKEYFLPKIKIADGANVELADAYICSYVSPISTDIYWGDAESLHNLLIRVYSLYDESLRFVLKDYDANIIQGWHFLNRGIVCEGDAVITLKGTSTIESTYRRAGIYVPPGKTLTFKGSGALNVKSGRYGPAIGGDDLTDGDYGSVVVNSGLLRMYSDSGARAFGGPSTAVECGTLTINGGCVFADAGEEGVGKSSSPRNIVKSPKMKLWVDSPVELIGGEYQKRYKFDVTWNGKLPEVDEDEEESAGEASPKQLMKLASALPKAAPRLLGNSLELDDVDSKYVAGDGTIIKGTLNGRHKICIAPDASVILRDASIWSGTMSDSSPFAGLTCLGNATIRLEGDNSVSSFHRYFPAISVPTNCTLVIDGPGSLNAQGGNEGAAGIGGVYDSVCGSVIISNGVVRATGGGGGAGIGGGAGSGGKAGSVSIFGGSVEATGGTYGAGIGSGEGGTCYKVAINGGEVVATGGTDAAGIGTGKNGAMNSISIGSGIAKVTAVSGGAEKIGRGVGGQLERISISAPPLTDTTSGNTRTIYWSGNLSVVHSFPADEIPELVAYDGTVISGTTLNTSSGVYRKCKISIAPGARVKLNNATINTIGNAGVSDSTPWAGLTCLGDATIELVNENEINTFNADYPGIYVPRGCTLTIVGSGKLVANSQNAAGIGGGTGLPCGTISIKGGDVLGFNVSGLAAGIGGGDGSRCDGVEIFAGITKVEAYSSDSSAEVQSQPVGAGKDGYCKSVHIGEGVVEEDASTFATGHPFRRTFTTSPNVNLSTLTGNTTVQSGAVITGVLSNPYEITIAAGAEVTLSGVVISGGSDSGASFSGIRCLGDATIWLDGVNTVRGFYRSPAISVAPGSTLTIKSRNGDDCLFADAASYDSYSAGIGAGWSVSCGNIVIDGGIIKAYGGSQAAGIGGATQRSCGTITINGGSVYAYGGSDGAGIGCGVHNGNCGDITINAGITIVEATRGGASAQPVGAAYQSSCGTVTVASGLREKTEAGVEVRTKIYPNTDVDLSTLSSGSAPVVLRDEATVSGTLGVDRQVVVANGATVTLSDMTIDNGDSKGLTCLGDATIILEGENFIRANDDDYAGLFVPEGHTLTIKGSGSLEVWGGGYAAGIGAGLSNDDFDAGDIVIEGGVIKAVGGFASAGIGASQMASCGTIAILGGSITAIGGEYANGIGAGQESSCADVTIEPGIDYLSATCNGDELNECVPIGTQAGSVSGVSVYGGLVEESSETVSGDTITRNRTFLPAELDLSKLPEEMTELTLQDGMTIKGALGHVCKVSIAPGAHIGLWEATILGENDSAYKWAGLNCLGDATIRIRYGVSNICGFYEDYPGIYVPTNATLTIEGSSARLKASSNGYGSGIGGGYKLSCGNIVVNGGEIYAYGGKTSTESNSRSAAGIGTGFYPSSGDVTTCGDITINGGTIYAYGGRASAGIGSSQRSTCGTITIGPGITLVRAYCNTTTSGNSSMCENPIGAGYLGDCSGVAIDESLFTESTDANSIRIFPLQDVDLSAATGKITLRNGDCATGTLAGDYQVEIAAGARVWLRNATIQPVTTGEGSSNYKWPGIKCLGDATIVLEGVNIVKGFAWHSGIYIKKNKTLTITGEGTLNVNSDTFGSAAIGGCFSRSGVDNEDTCGNIVIEGGTINVNKTTWYSDYAPAIGASAATSNGSTSDAQGGYPGQGCGDITIRGGSITVVGSNKSAAIGAGCGTTCGNITIEPGVEKLVVQWDHTNVTDPIGKGGNISGQSSSCGTVTLTGMEDYEDETLNNVGSGMVSNKMKKRTYYQDWDGDLSTLSRNITVRHDMAIFGSFTASSTSTDYDITIADGVTVTLDGASITKYKNAGLTCNGNVTLILRGENTIDVTKDDTSSSDPTMPAIRVPFGSSLTIDGTGTLVAQNAYGSSSAAIGEKPYEPSGGGSIYIVGGAVTAYGGIGAAAIGSSDFRGANEYTRLEIGPDVVKVVAAAPGGTFYGVAYQHSHLIGPADSCRSASQGGGFSIDPSLVAVDTEMELPYYDTTQTYLVRTLAPDRIGAAFDAWKAEQNAQGANLSGAWDATDANGVANAFRYVFDRADAAFAGVVIIGFEADGEGAVAIQTLPIVNGKEFFTFTIVASDNADGTGNVMEYPLSVDDPEGITIIEEEYNPHRFFRIRIDVK